MRACSTRSCSALSLVGWSTVSGMRRIVCRISRTCSAPTPPSATAAASAGSLGGSSSPVDSDRPGTRSSASASRDPASAAEQFSSCRRNAAAVRQPCCSANPREATSALAPAALRQPPDPPAPTRIRRSESPAASRRHIHANSRGRCRGAIPQHLTVILRISVKISGHKEMLGAATDNSGAVHRGIATGRVKQFLTITTVDKLGRRNCFVRPSC